MDKRKKITWIRLMRHFLAIKSDIKMLNVKIESYDWNVEPKAKLKVTPKTKDLIVWLRNVSNDKSSLSSPDKVSNIFFF